MDRDKTRAKSLDAGIVLVAVRLVDLALAAEFGVERLDRNAVRGLRAVAAAFAHEIVDEDTLWRVRIQAAPSAAAAFRGGGVVGESTGETPWLTRIPVNLGPAPARG